MNTVWLCYPFAEPGNWGRFRKWVNEEHDEKGGKPGYSSDDCAHLNITMRVEVVFQKFVDDAPRLAAGVREVDGIDSFFPSLLLLIVELWK